jgi:hypothetical protein
VCVRACILPIVARQRLGKNPLIFARQRFGKNPPIVARQRLSKNPLIVVRQQIGAPDIDKTVTVTQQLISGHEPQMGLETKTH